METPLTRYACLWVPHFRAAVLVRRDPALRGRPVAALAGTAAARVVLDATPEAKARGVRPGMPAGEAQTRAPELVGRERDPEAERSATGALLDVAWATSPRVEVAAPDRLHLDLAGLGELFPSEPRLGERLVEAAAVVELPARVGIADSVTAAALAARAWSGVSVVPPGRSGAVLAPLPVDLLDPAAECRDALERWGIRTLGQLAALPPAGVLARLGPPGARLQATARGEDLRPFVPAVPAEPCAESLTLDWEVTSLGGLAFVLQRLLDQLCARLAVRGLGAEALTLTAGLGDGTTHSRRLGLIAPIRESRTLLGLLLASLDGLALPAPVVALRIEAEPARLPAYQADLFAPTRPSPRELAETLGRLAALVGPDRVGAPRIEVSHRPDAVGMAPFVAVPAARTAAVAALALTDAATLACRRLTPPLPAAVEVHDGSPARVEAAGVRGVVVRAAGPWRTAGEWWADTAWTREEWDVALSDGAVYRLACDPTAGKWQVWAIYD